MNLDPNDHLFQRFSKDQHEHDRRLEEYVHWLEAEISKVELSMVKMQQELRAEMLWVDKKIDRFKAQSSSLIAKDVWMTSGDLIGEYAAMKSVLYELMGLAQDPFHSDPMYNLRKITREEDLTKPAKLPEPILRAFKDGDAPDYQENVQPTEELK